MVRTFNEEEFLSYMRYCACAKASHREGWGISGMSSSSTAVLLLLSTSNEGTKYDGVRLHTAILDTVSHIGKFAAFVQGA